MTDLITQLRGLSDEDMSQFSDKELAKIQTTLSGMSPPPASLADTKLTSTGNAAMNASPFIDPGIVTDDAFQESETPTLDDFGSATGGIVGGLTAAQKTQSALSASPPLVRGVGTIAAGALGAFTGGASGDLVESGVESVLDLEQAPDSAKAAFMQAVTEGGEEAAFDAIGNSLFIGGGALFKSLRPQASKLGESVKALLEGGGSSASIGQTTDNFLYTGLEKLTRGAFVGGGSFKQLDLAQDDAIVKYGQDYIKNFTDVAVDNLTDTAAGKLILDTVKGGKSAHSDAAKLLYAKVDELSGGLSVDVSKVKRIASSRIEDMTATGNVGRTTEGGSLLDNVAGLEDNLSFEHAQILRSDLLEQGRMLSDTKKDQAVARNINNMVAELDKAFEVVPAGDEALVALKKANKFYKFGKKNFNNKLISSMVKREDLVSKIAPSVFRKGNKEEIRALRNAVKVASKLDEGIVFDKVWGDIQGSYLKSLLPASIDDVLKAPIRNLHKDKALRKTLTAAFTKEQREGITTMSKAIDEILTKRGASGGLINLRQMGTGAQIFAGGMASADGQVNMGEVTAILGIPLLFSKIATSPKLAAKWVKWAAAKPNTAAKKVALVKLAHTLNISKEQLDPTNATGEPPEVDKPITGRNK